MGHHHRREVRAQLLENADLTCELGVAGVEHGQLLVGVGADPTEPREVLAATGHAPRGQSLFENAGQDHDPFRIVAEAPPLPAEAAARALEVHHRRQIDVHPEAPAGGAGRLAQGPYRTATGLPGLRRSRQVTPQGAEPVDDAALEIDCDKGCGLQLAQLFHERSGLLGGHDIAREEDDAGGSHPFEDFAFRLLQLDSGHSNHQWHHVNCLHARSDALH